ETVPALREPPELVVPNVQARRGGQVEDDPARAAADVQHALGLRHEVEHDAVARALPVALEPDRAVEGARVVGRGLDRVAKLPQAQQRLQIGPAEAQDARVRAAGPARHVVEWDLTDPPTLRADAHEQLLQDIEIARAKTDALEHIAAVHAKAAG